MRYRAWSPAPGQRQPVRWIEDFGWICCVGVLHCLDAAERNSATISPISTVLATTPEPAEIPSPSGAKFRLAPAQPTGGRRSQVSVDSAGQSVFASRLIEAQVPRADGQDGRISLGVVDRHIGIGNQFHAGSPRNPGGRQLAHCSNRKRRISAPRESEMTSLYRPAYPQGR